MKQQLDLVVTTYVDLDQQMKQGKTRHQYEAALIEAIKKAVRKTVGTPAKNTDVVDFSYGDPV